MNTFNSTREPQLIPVKRNPKLAKKLPLAQNPEAEAEQRRLAEEFRGTTPQGREIIRKRLFTLQRQQEAKMGIFPIGLHPSTPVTQPEPPKTDVLAEDDTPTPVVTLAHPT